MFKKIYISFWNKFIHEGYLVAAGDVSALCAFSIILGVKVTWDFLLIIFLLIFSLISYNFYKEINQDVISNPKRAEITKNRTRSVSFIIIFTFLLALLLTYYFSSVRAIFFLIVVLTIGFLYTLRFKQLTKKITGFKSFYVSLSYPLMILFLAIYYDLSLTASVLILYFFYFSRIFINTVFCDIRDIESDRSAGLKTFPVVFGEKKTIYFLGIINLFSLIPIIVGVYVRLLPTFSLVLLFTVLYILFCLTKYKKQNMHNTDLFNILVEGEFIFWLPLVLIGKNFLFK